MRTISISLGLLILLCYCQGQEDNIRFQQPCETYFDSIHHDIVVPEGGHCQMTQQLSATLPVLSQIILNGILEIENGQDIHLKYQSISFGPNGKLLIGQQQSITSSSVIFEDISESCASPQNTTGLININSLHYSHYTLVKDITINGTKLVQLDSTIGTEVIPGQLTIIDFSQNRDQAETLYPFCGSEYDQVLLCENIEGRNITIPEENLLPSPLILVLRNSQKKGVYFINSCLSTFIDSIIGVTFIDAQAVFFKGDQILSSAFTSSDTSKTPLHREQHFTFEANLRNNFFMKCDIRLTQDQKYTFKDNVFLSAFSTKFGFGSNFFSNYIINSRLILDVPTLQTIDMTRNIIFHSKLTINNSINSVIRFDNNHLLFSEYIEFQNDVLELFFNQNRIINSFFDLRNIRVNSKIEISNSFIYQTNSKICTFMLHPVQISLLQINLNQNKLMGPYLTLFYASKESQLQAKNALLGNMNMPHKYHIRMFQNIINKSKCLSNDEYQTQLFSLPHQSIVFESSSDAGTLTLIEVEDYNQSGNNFKEIQPFFSANPNERFLSTTAPFYFQFRIFSYFESMISQPYYQVTRNGAFEATGSHLDYFQITDKQIKQVYFYSKERNQDKQIHPYSFTLNLQNPYLSEGLDGTYTLFLNFERMPIQQVNLQMILYSTTESPKRFTNITLVHEKGISIEKTNANQIKLNWTTEISHSMSLHFDMKYCFEGQFVFQGNCENSCPMFTQKFMCTQFCEYGFYQKDSRNCEQCREGCFVCTEETNCFQCAEGYVKHKSFCFDTCPQNYTSVYKICETSTAENLISQNNNSLDCSSCYQMDDTKKCPPTQYRSGDSCSECDPSCSSCLGPTNHECGVCSSEYREFYGVCIPRKP